MPAISWPMRDDENCSIKMNKPRNFLLLTLPQNLASLSIYAFSLKKSMSHAKSFTFSTAIKKQKRLSKESNIYAVEK